MQGSYKMSFSGLSLLVNLVTVSQRVSDGGWDGTRDLVTDLPPRFPSIQDFDRVWMRPNSTLTPSAPVQSATILKRGFEMFASMLAGRLSQQW